VSDTTSTDFVPDEDYPWDDDQSAQPEPILQPVTSEEVRKVLQQALASCHLRPSSEMAGLVAQIKAAPKILSTLSEPLRQVYNALFEALRFEAATLTPTAELDFEDVAAIVNHTPAAAAELATIAKIATDRRAVKNPTGHIAALTERLQALSSRASMKTVIKAIDAQATAEAKMKAFKEIVAPSTQVAVVRETGLRTAYDLDAESDPNPLMRISSGYATLDLALTGPGGSLGYIGLGEETIFAGPTGTGKTSLQGALTRNGAQDIINQGFPDSPVLMFHTEEESADRAANMELRSGQRYHYLAKNIVVEGINSSRRRMVEIVYDAVVVAIKRSQEESRPITDFLPRLGFLDYIQALAEPNEESNTAHMHTAGLVKNGLQAFNPEEIHKFSGLDFRTYTGMAWPSGIEDHRMAMVVFAQLKKSEDSAMFYKKRSRSHSLSDFTMEDPSENPGWRDEDGNGWAWEVKENDYALFRKNQISGASDMMNNATTIIVLHRSRPVYNPAIIAPDGSRHLTDLRARLIPDKSRNGQEMAYVPMHFDLQPAPGKKAQYYDPHAEAAIESGELLVHESYRVSGDPILPRRPKASPFAGVRY
jgi:hypothetical protein